MSLSRNTSSCVFSATLGATTAASMMFKLNDFVFFFFAGLIFFHGFVTNAPPLHCDAIALACGRWVYTMPQVYRLTKRA